MSTREALGNVLNSLDGYYQKYSSNIDVDSYKESAG
jgi:hypothetical protein